MAKSNHQQVVKESDYYELVLNSIEDYAVFTTDKQGIVNSWNTGSEHLLGYKAKDILGLNTSVFFTEADLKRSADRKELKKAKKDGSALDERYHVRKDKTQFWASGKMFPLYDKAGTHIGFTKVMRNLNERKLAEQQLRQVSDY